MLKPVPIEKIRELTVDDLVRTILGEFRRQSLMTPQERHGWMDYGLFRFSSIRHWLWGKHTDSSFAMQPYEVSQIRDDLEAKFEEAKQRLFNRGLVIQDPKQNDDDLILLTDAGRNRPMFLCVDAINEEEEERLRSLLSRTRQASEGKATGDSGQKERAKASDQDKAIAESVQKGPVNAPVELGTGIFVGHGNSPLHHQVITYLLDEFGLHAHTFERHKIPGGQVIPTLDKLLIACGYADMRLSWRPQKTAPMTDCGHGRTSFTRRGCFKGD